MTANKFPGEVFIMRGYSGSGKTTAARRIRGGTAVIVSRDDIRYHAFGFRKTVLTPKEEQEVTKIQEALVRANLAAGRTVVIDDTNLRAKHARRWVDLAVELGAPYKVLDETADKDTCILRNLGRPEEERVPASVIERQAKRFPIKNWTAILPTPKSEDKFERYLPNATLPSAYVFDIDGTVADMRDHRSPYDPSKYHLDHTFPDVVDLLHELESNHAILFLTGRDEAFRDVTETWLNHHIGISGPLFMRPEGDTRNDGIVKNELFDKHVGPFYNVKGVFDDRLRVCRVWHAKGLTLFRVGDPDADY